MEAIEVLNFSAPWCGPCRSMAPVIQELMEAGWKITKINSDEQKDLAQAHAVYAIPTFIVLNNGNPVRRFTGARTKQALLGEFNLAAQ